MCVRATGKSCLGADHEDAQREKTYSFMCS